MARFSLQKNALGFDMPDGTHYVADRTGHVDIPDPRHAQAIRASMQVQRQWAGQTPYTFEGAAENRCLPCRFTAFAWQDHCPRCGADFAQEQPA